MKSFDVCECGAPLKLMERPTPKPTGSEVLLKVLAAGVCHSDLHIWDGYYDLGGGKRLQLTDRGVKLPLTMGHENVGEVVAVGPDAKGVKVGDRRLVHPWIGCGDCAICRHGEEQLCHDPVQHRGVPLRRLRGSSAGAASALSVRHRQYSARARRAARLFGHHHLRGAEEGRADVAARAGGDHRRRRARPDVPCAAQGDGRQGRHRGRHRSGQARGRQGARRAPDRSIRRRRTPASRSSKPPTAAPGR